MCYMFFIAVQSSWAEMFKLRSMIDSTWTFGHPSDQKTITTFRPATCDIESHTITQACVCPYTSRVLISERCSQLLSFASKSFHRCYQCSCYHGTHWVCRWVSLCNASTDMFWSTFVCCTLWDGILYHITLYPSTLLDVPDAGQCAH